MSSNDERPITIEVQPHSDRRALNVDHYPDIPLDQRHHRFFIPEEFITLKVDSVYFNIPTFVLKAHSKRFQKVLDRGDEDLACLLKGVTAIDLERFLSIIFPSNYEVCDAHTVEQWSSILKVAHSWDVKSIYNLALDWIEPRATPVDMVVLGTQYNLPEWLKAGRLGLCRRDEPLTEGEAGRMGLQEAIRISAARHRIRPSQVQDDVEDSTILSLLPDKSIDDHTKDPCGLKACRDNRIMISQDMSHSQTMSGSSLEGRAWQSLSSERCHERISLASSSTTHLEAPPGLPPIPPSAQHVPTNQSEALDTQEPLLTLVAPTIVSRQDRISRALELRKLLHDLDVDEEGAQPRAKLNGELTSLFEGLSTNEWVEYIPSPINLDSKSAEAAVTYIEGLLELYLRPGMARATLSIKLSTNHWNRQRQDTALSNMLTRYGLEYHKDLSYVCNASIPIPIHGCLPPSLETS